jgi:hypothetical protein
MKLLPDDETDEPWVDEPLAASITVESLRHGLPPPQQPLGEDGQMLQPKMPDDLSRATPDRLGKLMGQLVACANYATYLAAVDDVAATLAENRLEFLTAHVRQQKTGNSTVRRDKARNDPRVREANREFLTATAKHKLTTALLDNYERQIAAVSREISRRQLELERAIQKID